MKTEDHEDQANKGNENLSENHVRFVRLYRVLYKNWESLNQKYNCWSIELLQFLNPQMPDYLNCNVIHCKPEFAGLKSLRIVQRLLKTM